MTFGSYEEAATRVHEESTRLLADRVTPGLWTILAFLPLLTCVDVWVHRAHIVPLSILTLAHIALTGISLAVLDRRHDRRTSIRLGLTNVLALLLLGAIRGALVGDTVTLPLLSAVLPLASMALLPWGIQAHLVLVAGAAVTTFANLQVAGGLPWAHIPRLLILFAVWVGSGVIVHRSEERKLDEARADLERERERNRAQQELRAETWVAASLARVGQDLMGCLNNRLLLDRLCQTTAEVLHCDFSHTWMWDAAEDAIVPVAGFGDPPEIWQSLRMSRIPRDLAVQGDLVSFLTRGEPGEIRVADENEQESLPAGLRPVVYVRSVLLCMPLHRGRELIGAQVAGYRNRTTSFTTLQRRILKEIAQLVSAALEYTLTVERLDEANRLKSDLFSQISQELREPVTVVMGYVDLALNGEFGEVNPQLTEALQRVSHTAHLLMNAAAQLKQLDVEHAPADRRRIEIRDLVAQLGAECERMRESPDVTLHWQVAEDLLWIETDYTKLMLVLRNLLSNAFKFTYRGSVSVTIRPRARGVELMVHDTGVGIPEEIRAAIFEPHYSGDHGAERPAGLGLHVARRIVQVMGGTMKVESQVGAGSTFRLWIPCELGIVMTRGTHAPLY